MTSSRSADRRLRLIQVGMGGWGRDWMSVAAGVPGVEPVAWVDPSREARAATVALGAPAGRVFPTLEAALGAVPADAALVTTQVEHHVPVTLAALDAGMDVLLEKPFAPTLAEATTAVRAAEAAGRTLMISQNYRYHPAPRLAASLIAGGRIGAVSAVEIDFRRNADLPADVLRRHRAMDHPLLVDMAIHHFDMLRLLLACEPEWVEVAPVNPGWSEYRDPPAAYATLAFPGEIVVSYRGSWISSGPRTPWGGLWRVEGTDGGLEFATRGDGEAPDRLRLRTPVGAARPMPLPAIAALDRAGSTVAFVAAVRDGSEPETSARRNLPTLAMTFAAVRAATERRRVTLAELLDELPEDLR